MTRSDNHLTYKELIKVIRNLNDEITQLKNRIEYLEEGIETLASERDDYMHLYNEMKNSKDSRYDSLLNSLSELLDSQKEEQSGDMPF